MAEQPGRHGEVDASDSSSVGIPGIVSQLGVVWRGGVKSWLQVCFLQGLRPRQGYVQHHCGHILRRASSLQHTCRSPNMLISCTSVPSEAERMPQRGGFSRTSSVLDQGEIRAPTRGSKVHSRSPDQQQPQLVASMGTQASHSTSQSAWTSHELGQVGKKHPQSDDDNWKIYKIFKSVDLTSTLAIYLVDL